MTFRALGLNNFKPLFVCMKNLILKSFSGLALLVLASCNDISTNSGRGAIFTEVKEPVAFSNGVSSTKTGEACQESYFGLVSTGDSSIETAKQNGNITKVASINLEKKNVLVYGRTCTVVKGE